MKNQQKMFILLMILFIISACKKDNPCDNPKTVKELLACANTVGAIDSTWVGIGAQFNKGCDNSWNAKDTVLTVTYKDSIILWRVNQHKNKPGDNWGSWFTNISAKAAGYTKEETLDLFALNPCPDSPNIYKTCKCVGKIPSIDSVIKYEEKVKIGPNQKLNLGVTGKNPFGNGGSIQWHLLHPKKGARYTTLEQIRWE